MREASGIGSHDGGPPYRLHEPDTSLGELFGRLPSEMSSLLNDHIQLARFEVKEEMRAAGRGAGFMGGAAVGGWIAALILSLALAWGLAELMPTWVAFLIVGVIWAIVAAVLLTLGQRELKEVTPVAPQTQEELRRDRRWFSSQTN